jgi:hypothetical protein
MTRPCCPMHSLLLPFLVALAFITGATAVAQGTHDDNPPAACRLWQWSPERVSVLHLPLTATMQNDSDSVDISPGTRTFLEPNFPNPFPVTTTIAYSIAEDTRVQLKVYDFDYVEVATLVDADQLKGRHVVIFDTRELDLRVASGVYFYELKTKQGIEQRRMIYMK